MSQTPKTAKKIHYTAEARCLVELARAAGLGDSPDAALEWNDHAVALIGTDDETPFLADVLRWQATVLLDRGQTSKAGALCTRSLELSTKLGYVRGRAHALNDAASIALRRGDLVQSANLMSSALALADECGETRLVGMLQQNLGIVADIRGNPAAALAHYRVSLETFESTNDVQPLCCTLNNLGYLHLEEGRYDEANNAFERALGIARARGDLCSEGIIEENRTELRFFLGQIDTALASLQRALTIAELRGDNIRRAAALKLRGAHERMTGQPAAALQTLGHALTLSEMGEDARLGGEILYQFGLAYHALGDQLTAQTAWKAALEAFERIAARQWVGRIQKQLTTGDSTRYL